MIALPAGGNRGLHRMLAAQAARRVRFLSKAAPTCPKLDVPTCLTSRTYVARDKALDDTAAEVHTYGSGFEMNFRKR